MKLWSDEPFFVIDIMSAYIPLIKLTQRRKDAKVIRLFHYGLTPGLDMIRHFSACTALDFLRRRLVIGLATDVSL